ncbi:hypothetical protein HY486_03035 [Candidatus Woesearchaeota archaeon]|nr:hypothetical protein [Candidatus Woesearchaeota archaeon]
MRKKFILTTDTGVMNQPLAIMFVVFFVALSLFYTFSKENTGKAYIVTAEQNNCANPTKVCTSQLRRCETAKDPCLSEQNQITCSWRLGPNSITGRKSGCYKACFENNKASLKECR